MESIRGASAPSRGSGCACRRRDTPDTRRAPLGDPSLRHPRRRPRTVGSSRLRADVRPHRSHRRRRRATSTRPSSSTRAASGCPLAHREIVEEQGVEAVLLDVGDGHVELLAPARRRTRRSASSSPARARASITSPTGSPTSTRPSPTLGGRRRADRPEPRVGIRNSRVALPASAGHRRRADRDRPAPARRTDGSHREHRVSVGFEGGQVLATRMSEKDLTALNSALSAPRTGSTSRARTARSASTSGRSSTSARTATSPASASAGRPGDTPPRSRGLDEPN